MRVIKTVKERAVEQIAGEINLALKKGKVLLLVSGGSNITLSVNIRKKLQLDNELTVGLIDERYGEVGHSDSNWAKLIEAGFEVNGIKSLPVLCGKSFEDTALFYEGELSSSIAKSSAVIGIFGIGEDGHTSGVLPGSTAVTSNNLIVAYIADDYSRITTTPAAFKYFDTAYLVGFGANKRAQLDRLIKADVPIVEQPAQALKRSKELIIYRDDESVLE